MEDVILPIAADGTRVTNLLVALDFLPATGTAGRGD